MLSGASALAGIGPVYYLVNANLQAAGLGVTLFMALLAGLTVSLAGPNMRAIMLNVNDPETRGVALAMQTVTDDLGRGIGPIIVAGFIGGLGRQHAFNVAIAGWVPCGLLLLGLVFCMSKDEAAMQARLARRVSNKKLLDVEGGNDNNNSPSGNHINDSNNADGSATLHAIELVVHDNENVKQGHHGCSNDSFVPGPNYGQVAGDGINNKAAGTVNS